MIKEICSCVYRELRRKCKGKVTVIPYREFKDSLCINITVDNITFAIYIDEIEQKMLNGITSRLIVDEVISKYKSYLLSKYFY